jgi:hypothetical protein
VHDVIGENWKILVLALLLAFSALAAPIGGKAFSHAETRAVFEIERHDAQLQVDEGHCHKFGSCEAPAVLLRRLKAGSAGRSTRAVFTRGSPADASSTPTANLPPPKL